MPVPVVLKEIVPVPNGPEDHANEHEHDDDNRNYHSALLLFLEAFRLPAAVVQHRLMIHIEYGAAGHAPPGILTGHDLPALGASV